ncbi:MAG: aminoacyl-tRNA hydrolase [Patescibacteria group bacterium]|nr:aminoacyl-tRNA hydrolase [Patescibacteria group bacterium]
MIIIGLGNPGTQYNRTRHNAGFAAIDAIAKANGFGEFKLSKKHNSLISEGIINDNKVLLAKPQNFMNNSGSPIKSLIKQDKNFTVIHDDIDIPLGKIKTAEDSSSAGHKGVQDIIQALGTKDFNRIRIGIQPKQGKPDNTEEFVLQKFTEEEQKLLNKTIKEIISK